MKLGQEEEALFLFTFFSHVQQGLDSQAHLPGQMNGRESGNSSGCIIPGVEAEPMEQVPTASFCPQSAPRKDFMEIRDHQ